MLDVVRLHNGLMDSITQSSMHLSSYALFKVQARAGLRACKYTIEITVTRHKCLSVFFAVHINSYVSDVALSFMYFTVCSVHVYYYSSLVPIEVLPNYIG